MTVSSEGARACAEWGVQWPARSAGTIRVAETSPHGRRVRRMRRAASSGGQWVSTSAVTPCGAGKERDVHAGCRP